MQQLKNFKQKSIYYCFKKFLNKSEINLEIIRQNHSENVQNLKKILKISKKIKVTLKEKYTKFEKQDGNLEKIFLELGNFQKHQRKIKKII